MLDLKVPLVGPFISADWFLRRVDTYRARKILVSTVLSATSKTLQIVGRLVIERMPSSRLTIRLDPVGAIMIRALAGSKGPLTFLIVGVIYFEIPVLKACSRGCQGFAQFFVENSLLPEVAQVSCFKRQNTLPSLPVRDGSESLYRRSPDVGA